MIMNRKIRKLKPYCFLSYIEEYDLWTITGNPNDYPSRISFYRRKSRTCYTGWDSDRHRFICEGRSYETQRFPALGSGKRFIRNRWEVIHGYA